MIDAASLANSSGAVDAAEVHDREQVEVDDGAQLLERLVLERAVVVRRRVVDEDVEPAVLPFDVHARAARGTAGRTRSPASQLAPPRSSANASSRSARRAVSTTVGARGGEHPGEAVAEPGGRAGHERDASVEAEQVVRARSTGVAHPAESRVRGPTARHRHESPR